MTETIARMFSLLATAPERLAECWSASKADPQVLIALAAAGPPVSFAVDSEHSTARDGVLFAAVRVRANWAGDAPPGWEGSELTAVMRQQRDWSWTIDTIQPRIREGQRDAHCAMCHRGVSPP